MLITFYCKRFHDVTMFGDLGLLMLRAMGRGERVPGILPAEEVPQALAALRAWLEGRAAAEQGAEDDEESAEARPVRLQHRALPLMEMLEKASQEGLDVNWK